MSFSAAQYQATLDKINRGTQDLSAKLQQVGPKAESTANKWYVPQPVADALIWVANKLIEAGTWLLEKIGEVMEGAAAPLTLFFYAHDWQSDVRGKATTVAGETAAEALKAPSQWEGEAADAYVNAVKDQPTAAAKVGTSAEKISSGLTWSAVAGLAFYVAIGVIIVKFIIATVAAIAALGSVVFSWAGAAIIVEEAGVNSALIIAAVTTLVGALGTQAQQMANVEGEAQDNSAYPGGKWPSGIA